MLLDRALREDISYRTLMASILHKYVHGAWGRGSSGQTQQFSAELRRCHNTGSMIASEFQQSSTAVAGDKGICIASLRQRQQKRIMWITHVD